MTEPSRRLRALGQGSHATVVVGALAVVGVTATLLITFGIFAATPVLEADLSTYLLPGKGLLEGRGDLYVDYFDIKAPLIYALLVPGLLVSESLAFWWCVYAVLLGVMFWLFWLGLRSVLTPWPALLALGSCCLVLLHFRMLEELFFTTEVLGLALMLGGLAVARRWSSAVALVGAGALAGSAGNVKEVFLLAPLALIPLALRHPGGRRRGLVWTGVGVVGAYAATVAVLVMWGPSVLSGYLEVLSFKRQRFPAPGVDAVFTRSADYAMSIGTWLPLLGVLVVGLGLALILSRRAVWSAAEPHSWTGAHTSLSVLLGAVLIGFVWQGGPMEVHYALAVIIPLYLALGAVVGWGLSRARGLGSAGRTTVTVLLLVGLVPAPAAVLWGVGSVRAIDVGALGEAARNLERPEDRATFTQVASLTDRDDCIQVAYGWSASAYYWYSDRDPCARFIVPPLALSPELSAEYRQALVDSPPSVIVFDPALVSETTVPASDGTADTTIVPFARIVTSCYQPVPGHPTLYLPLAERAETSACIAREVAGMPDGGGAA